MEVSLADDKMEMGSPYQGNADDFEIDLDVMEDQASNVDHDLDVADASPDTYHEQGLVHDSTNDADMMDEIAERAMVDADDNHQQTHEPDDHSYYQTEETYEAEMLEDEYEEDIDAPVPETKERVIADVEHGPEDRQDVHGTTDFPEQNLPSEKEHHEEAEVEPEDGDGDQGYNVHDVHNEVDEAHEVNEAHEVHENDKLDGHDTEEVVKDSTNDQYQIEQQDNRHVDTNNAAPVEPQPSYDLGDGEEGEPSEQEGEYDHYEAAEVYSSVDKHEDRVETKDVNEADHEGADTVQQMPQLYPVKVLYQDSEISLFPPQEGDSSETFFLEDENLAHQDVGKLLASCRQVLGEHVGEDEVLVVDIESLNLQLSEDSSHISKVTLSQIVELYLQLCHNDGVDEPEPLYLTLSTKLTLPSEISNLFAAANEGKGLSHIHPWDEYEEVEQDAGDIHEYQGPESEGQTAPVPSEEFPPSEGRHHDDEPEAEQEYIERQSPEEAVHKHLETSNTHDSTHIDNAESKPETNEDSGVVYEDGDDGTEEGGHYGTDVHTQPNTEGIAEPSGGPAHAASPKEGPYDFEEQATESTATLAHASVAQSTDEQKPDQSAEDAGHDQVGSDDYDNQVELGPDTDFLEEEEEEEANVEASEYINGVEATDTDGGEASYKETMTETRSEHNQSRESFSPVHPQTSLEAEDDGADELDVVHVQSDDVHSEAAQTPHDQAAATANDVQSGGDLQDTADETGRRTPELADDLLGIDEDLLKSPAKGAKETPLPQEIDQDSGNAKEHDDVVEDSYTADGSGSDYEELRFDEEDDIGLGSTETPDVADGEVRAEETQLPESVPYGKRPRGPDDEFDLVETPTPDTKRRRSS